MAYKFKEIWCNRSNYTPANRTVNDIDYIVIHYTGNDGDADENNGNYFKNNYVGASAHYFVDSDSVTRSVADKNIAWHCGDDVYYHKYCRNSNSIGIEICDDNYSGSIYPSAKTIENAILLTQRLMKKYNIPKENVVRHWDVTHKICPAYWSGSSEKDKRWKSEFWNRLDNSVNASEKTTVNEEVSIKTVQKWLNDNYKTGLSVDGIYGSLTKKALIKALQTELNKRYGAGLIVDEIFGDATKSAIHILSKGAKGNFVKILQGFLICNNYDTNGFDGIFGEVTESAVKSYQKENGLIIDGIAGEEVFSKFCDYIDKPTITYKVLVNGKWLPEVKGLSDYAGLKGKAIEGIAVKTSKGKVKYRVHTINSGWLSYITNYNINDYKNGWAGNREPIDAIEVIVTGCGKWKATYRVSPLNKDYYNWQHNNERDSKQDGYAGYFGKAIDRIQLTLT